MASLEDLLMGRMAERERDTRDPEAKIMELREWATRYHTPNTFKVGDIVTARKGCGLRGDGEPCLIIRIDDHGLPHGTSEAGHHGTAEIKNVMALHFDGGDVISHTYPHWKLEPFTA